MGEDILIIRTAMQQNEALIFAKYLDTNKILNTRRCKDLNQEKGETPFLIWYDYQQI
jgi:hypothetical protein